MPYCTTLQVHFLAISERIAALGTPGARRVEVMIVTSLEHLTANVSVAVGTLDPERFLEILLTVRDAILAHVLAVQCDAARVAPGDERNVYMRSSNFSTCITLGYSLEAPDVPLPVERNQRLTFLQLLMATGALVRIDVFIFLLLSDCFLVVLKGSCLGRAGGNFLDRVLFQHLLDLSLW